MYFTLAIMVYFSLPPSLPRSLPPSFPQQISELQALLLEVRENACRTQEELTMERQDHRDPTHSSSQTFTQVHNHQTVLYLCTQH